MKHISYTHDAATGTLRHIGRPVSVRSKAAHAWDNRYAKERGLSQLDRALQNVVELYSAKISAGAAHEIPQDEILKESVMALEGPGAWVKRVLGRMQEAGLAENESVMAHLRRYCPEIELMELREQINTLRQDVSTAAENVYLDEGLVKFLGEKVEELPLPRWERLHTMVARSVRTFEGGTHLRLLLEQTREAAGLQKCFSAARRPSPYGIGVGA